MTEKIAHTIREAQEAGGVGHTTIYKAIADGKLKARKLGRRTLILDSELRRWIEGLPEFRRLGCPPSDAAHQAGSAVQPKKSKNKGAACDDEDRRKNADTRVGYSDSRSPNLSEGSRALDKPAASKNEGASS